MKRRIVNSERSFEADACYKTHEAGGVSFRAVSQSEFEKLRNRLLGHKLEQIDVPGLESALRRAANAAAAEAQGTEFPELFFPDLFEEKAKAERDHAVFQARLRIRSRAFLASWLFN